MIECFKVLAGGNSAGQLKRYQLTTCGNMGLEYERFLFASMWTVDQLTK